MQKLPPLRKQTITLSPALLFTFVFFTAGICWADYHAINELHLLYVIILLFCFISVLHAAKIRVHVLFSCLILGILLFLIGSYHIKSKSAPPEDPNHIFNQITTTQTVSLYGTLVKLPASYAMPSGTKTRLLMEVEGLLKDTGLRLAGQKLKKVSGLILLTLQGPAPDGLKPGDHFLVRSKVSPVNTFATPGSFDYRRHLASQSVFLKGWIDAPGNILKIQPMNLPALFLSGASLLYVPERTRDNIADFLNQAISQPSRGLYKAILIGDRSDIAPSVLENFIQAGCVHILAISGMHMGLLALLTITAITWLLKRSTWLMLQVDIRKAAVSLALPPLLIYALIAGFNIPVQRALLMTTIFTVAILFERPGNLINHILLAALLVLAWQPRVVSTAAFQLSFVAVTAIGLIYPLLHNMLWTKSRNNRSCQSKQNSTPLPSRSKAHSLLVKLAQWPLTGIVITTAVMLGTAPLLLYHFNRISLVAPLANLLVEPLICFWSLIVGIIACIFIPLAPSMSVLLFKAGSLGLVFADKICTFFAALPLASIRLPTPTLIEITFYYIFFLSIVMMLYLGSTRKRICLVTAFFSFLFLLSLPAISKINKNMSTTTTVSILDIGHGSAIVLQLPHNKNILIDGGGSGSEHFNIGERIIGPFLWNKQISSLDAVVISHPHADHYNGLEFILTNFRPGQIWINGMPGHDPEYRKLLDLAQRLDIMIRVPRTDDLLFQSGTTRLLCIFNAFTDTGYHEIYPGSSLKDHTNDKSLVLKLEAAGKSFLFPGDISTIMADFLVAERKNIASEMLLAPHHGSRTSISSKFIASVNPDYIAISAGQNNPFNFPDRFFYDLEKNGIQVNNTGQDGTLTYTVEDGEILLSRYQDN